VGLVASLAALLPNAAWAHGDGPAGANGEKVNIDPDGYNEDFQLLGRHYLVTGTGFIPGVPVEVFQCAVSNSVNLHSSCQPLGVMPALPTGGDFTIAVYMRQSFSSVQSPFNPDLIADAPFGTEVGGTTCAGSLGVQCAVVAAQFVDPSNPLSVLGNPVRRAEHYICFGGRDPAERCVDQPTNRWW